MEREIVIAGAGVAGLTAAINLKRAGRAVRVMERNPASGAPALPRLGRGGELDLGRRSAARSWSASASKARASAMSGHTRLHGHRPLRPAATMCRRPRPFFYLIKRGASAGRAGTRLAGAGRGAGHPHPVRHALPAGPGRHLGRGHLRPGVALRLGGLHLPYRPPRLGLRPGGLHASPPAPTPTWWSSRARARWPCVLTEARREANRLLERAAADVPGNTPTLDDPRPAQVGRQRRRPGRLLARPRGVRDRRGGRLPGLPLGLRHPPRADLGLPGRAGDARPGRTGRRWPTARSGPLVRASLVNRWLYDRMPNLGLCRR